MWCYPQVLWTFVSNILNDGIYEKNWNVFLSGLSNYLDIRYKNALILSNTAFLQNVKKSHGDILKSNGKFSIPLFADPFHKAFYNVNVSTTSVQGGTPTIHLVLTDIHLYGRQTEKTKGCSTIIYSSPNLLRFAVSCYVLVSYFNGSELWYYHTLIHCTLTP